jgi:hypothetical protein
MRTRLLIALALVASIGAGCAAKLPPNTSPEAKVAIRGTQLVAGIRATLPTIKEQTCVSTTPPGTLCIDPKDAIVVVQNIQKAANVAVDLAKALEAVDNATAVDDKVSKTQRAKQLLGDIQNLILQSTAAPLNANSRQAIVGIMGSVTALLFSVF